MAAIIYNIPASRVEDYRGRKVLLRSPDPRELAELLTAPGQGDLAGLQLTSPAADISPLEARGYAIPVDVLLPDPGTDFPLLYHFSPLLTKHPLRVSLPVAPGFGKALKLALSLNFAVKLEVVQPGPELLEEMARALHFYLHHSTVAQPIDFFHGLLAAFYREDDALTLWTIQEEEPARFRYITDQGEETVSRRLAAMTAAGGIAAFLEARAAQLAAPECPCRSCEFLGNCAGYFKWPRPAYPCDGVKLLLGALKSAARELRRDLAAAPQAGQSRA